MSILAHDWLGAFHLYAGFLPPLHGLLVEACDPGAAARVPRALPRAIPFRPYRGLEMEMVQPFWDGMVCGLTKPSTVEVA
jgi:hypothetical protein